MLELAPSRSPRQKGWEIAKFFLAGLLILLVARYIQPQEVVLTFRSISLPWLGLAVLLFFGMLVLKTVRYALLLDVPVSWRDLFQVVILTNAIINLVATSAGMAAFVALLREKYKVHLNVSFGILLTVLVTEAGFAALALLGAMIWLRAAVIQSGLAGLLVLLLIVTALGVAAFGVILFWPTAQRGFQLPARLASSRGLSGLVKIIQEVDSQRAHIRRVLPSILAVSVAGVAAALLFGYAGVRALHLDVGGLPVILVTSMLHLVAYIPIHVMGGLGTVELTSLYLYGLLGLPEGEVAAYLVGSRVIFYLLNMVSLLVMLPLNGVKKRTA